MTGKSDRLEFCEHARYIGISVVAALVIGCMATAPSASATASARKVVFLCEGGRSLAVAFDEGSALLDAGGKPVHLEQQRVASGIHYAGSGHDLRGKGSDVNWTEPGGVTHRCRDQGASLAK